MFSDITEPQVKNINPFSTPLFFAFILALLVTITSCTLKGGYPYRHTFVFDFRDDSPGYEVLDYQYGSSKIFRTFMPEYKIKRNETVVSGHIGGVLPKGEFLYVKWRNKSTGEVYEDKADLTNCYPSDITGYTFTFFVKGPQLYVYLISPHKDRRPKEWPKGPIDKYGSLKQYELYPNKTDLSFIDEHPVSRSRR